MKMKKTLLLLLFFSHWLIEIQAQSVTESGAYTFRFRDSIKVELLAAYETITPNKGYYYLPTNLRVSTNEEKQPEFMLMSYQRDGRDEVIMHWLLTWGLDSLQQRRIDSLVLMKIDSSARVLGSLMMDTDTKIVFEQGKKGNSKLVTVLQRSITSGGAIPNLAGGKSATAFRCIGEDAILLSDVLKDETKAKDIFITMGFNYKVFIKKREGFNIAESRRIVLKIGLDEVFRQAKKCNDCIVMIK
jgi:hypothetical protein